MGDDDDIIVPAATGSADTTTVQEKPQRSFFNILTHAVRALCGFAALISLVAALWFFIGFIENDTGFLHLLSAFGMGMGLGALAFVPALWIARLARLTMVEGPRLSMSFLVILLAIPWGVLGGLLARLEGGWHVLGIAVMVLVTIINLWAFLMALHSRR